VRFIFFNSFISTAVAPVAFHYVTRIFHTPVGAIFTAVSLSKTHKFHSAIVIRYYARSRFRDTWLPVSAGGGQVIYIVVIARHRIVFSEHGNTRCSQVAVSPSLHSVVYATTHKLPLLAVPFVFLIVGYAFFLRSCKLVSIMEKKKMPEKGKNE